MSNPVFDNVSNPYHYNAKGEMENGRSKYEPIKVIEKWGFGYGFCMGNALKYILRAPYKGSEHTDIEKALWYLERANDFLAVHGGKKELCKQDDTCEGIDVVEAWDIEGDLAIAVEYIGLHNPRDAAQALKDYLKTY